MYWKGGPTLALGILKTDQSVPSGILPDADQSSKSTNFNIGINFATGLDYILSESYGVNLELGYRHLVFDRFDNDSSQLRNNTEFFRYRLDGIISSLGFTYRF